MPINCFVNKFSHQILLHPSILKHFYFDLNKNVSHHKIKFVDKRPFYYFRIVYTLRRIIYFHSSTHNLDAKFSHRVRKSISRKGYY